MDDVKDVNKGCDLCKGLSHVNQSVVSHVIYPMSVADFYNRFGDSISEEIRKSLRNYKAPSDPEDYFPGLSSDDSVE